MVTCNFQRFLANYVINDNSKAYPNPRVGGRFKIVFAKMKRKDELEDTRSNFTSLLCIFEHWDKTTPLWGARINFNILLTLQP